MGRRLHTTQLRCCLGFLASTVFCVGFSEARNRAFFQSSRALAMGDAFTAYTTGYEAVFYNPAGVARRSPPKAKIFDLEFQGSAATVSFLKGSFTDFGRLSNILQSVAEDPDKVHSFGLSYLPQFMVRNFSLGVLARSYTEVFVDSSTSNMDLFAYTDLAAYLHFGVAFGGGIVKLGVGGKFLNRAETTRQYTPAEYATPSGLTFADQWKEGVGYGVDVGLLVTVPTEWMPSFGVSVQDAGNTTLKEQRVIWTGSGGATGAPPNLKQRVNVGVGVQPKHTAGVKSGIFAELKDVLNYSDGALERFHLGYELNLREVFFVRAGLNQGRYWTGGLGIGIGGTGIEVSSYGENLLWGTTSRKSDRKYVLRYGVAF